MNRKNQEAMKRFNQDDILGNLGSVLCARSSLQFIRCVRLTVRIAQIKVTFWVERGHWKHF